MLCGSDSGSVLNTCDVYDAATNKWSPGPALPEPRRFACAAQVADGVYVAGGRGAGAGGVMSSCVRLGVGGEGGGWQGVKGMCTKRHSAAAASISSTQFVVCGGRGGSEADLDSVEA